MRVIYNTCRQWPVRRQMISLLNVSKGLCPFVTKQFVWFRMTLRDIFLYSTKVSGCSLLFSITLSRGAQLAAISTVLREFYNFLRDKKPPLDCFILALWKSQPFKCTNIGLGRLALVILGRLVAFFLVAADFTNPFLIRPRK